MEDNSEHPAEMSRERLIQELVVTREQLKRQKALMEMFINRCKETARELELLRKKKEDLHRDFEELKVAHSVNEEKYQADLQAEKDKYNRRGRALDRLILCHNRFRLRYETDLVEIRQQLNTLQHDLVKKMQQKATVEKRYKELHMALGSIHEKFTAKLQAEQQKNKLLREELDKISASQQEISQRYEADVNTVRQQTETLQHELQKESQQQKNNLLQDKLDSISQGYESEVSAVRQQAESLQRELEKEVKAHADTASKDLQVITNLRAEQDDLRHRMTEEINSIQQSTLEKDGHYERQLEELKTQLAAQISLNLELSTELKALKKAEDPKEKPSEQDSIATAPAAELLDVTQVSEVTHPGKPQKSLWKRVRHFLGLRKPQKWKN